MDCEEIVRLFVVFGCNRNVEDVLGRVEVRAKGEEVWRREEGPHGFRDGGENWVVPPWDAY